MADTHTILNADTNQALGIAQYAIDFLAKGEPDQSVIDRTELFHTDATICGLSAIALGTNAPNVLRNEALTYAVGENAPTIGKATKAGATVFGSGQPVQPEKAIAANSSAVREWDSNGTNFGYNPKLNHIAGEFGHNDFYPVPIAAAQMTGADGRAAVMGMIALDEIRGRLAEGFSLKTYKIDHVLHGGIASAAVFGAMLGATAEQIESAIGMVVAHHVPFRAIRAGKQLSDSKGASAAITTEAAIVAVRRSMAGFLGPRDIFRNPEAVFRIFEGPGQMFTKVGVDPKSTENADKSPFDLHLAMNGSDFAVMGMHFKLGLYEHQSAGAIQAIVSLLDKAPHLLDDPSGKNIATIRIVAYEPAFGIIGDPAKMNPTTRQSADHSMAYIIATLLRKALGATQLGRKPTWAELMLDPHDYSAEAIFNEQTRSLMSRIDFVHGGEEFREPTRLDAEVLEVIRRQTPLAPLHNPANLMGIDFVHGGEEYDRRYPDGIPTSVVITDEAGSELDSGLVMYPTGHARNTTADLKGLLEHKFKLLGTLAADEPQPIIDRFQGLHTKDAAHVASLNDFSITMREGYKDA